MRAAPFEDLGFARVDTHRELRQGFPEVILGIGKTPAQIAAIASRIVGARPGAARHAALSRSAYEAVRAIAPAATYHAEARAITLAQGEIPRGHGTILIACAGTSDLPRGGRGGGHRGADGQHDRSASTTSASPASIVC